MSFLNNIPANQPVSSLDGYLIAIHSKPKFGKTTFAIDLAKQFYGNLDSTLLLATEIGYKAIKDVRALPITTFRKTTDKQKEMNQYGFVEVVDELVANANNVPYKLLIIDTITSLEKYATEDTIKRMNKRDNPEKRYEDLNDILWGKAHNVNADSIYKQIDRLIKVGYGIIVIGHEKVSSVKTKSGLEYDKIEFDLSKKTSAILTREADLIIYGDLQVEKDKGGTKENRQLILRSDGSILCGSRIGKFPDKLPVDAKVFLKAFDEAIASLYDGDMQAVEEKRQVEAVARQEQISTYEEEPNEEDELTAEQVIEQITSVVTPMNRATKLVCGQFFAETLGTANYKEVDNIPLLKQALFFAKEQGTMKSN